MSDGGSSECTSYLTRIDYKLIDNGPGLVGCHPADKITPARKRTIFVGTK